jgi:hypothetical protein
MVFIHSIPIQISYLVFSQMIKWNLHDTGSTFLKACRHQSGSFGPSQTPIHLKTGRVHYHVIDSSTLQVPVQPETVMFSLVAAHHGSCISYAQMGLDS